jgi:FAD/FMN-containing dehydrogenase|tara:strand:- start:180 stop:1481 length:1302 start_codon:yes stop_codon:yes gene_type:complete
MIENLKILLEEFGEQKVKFTKEYLEKYGTDWYKEIKPDPLAIFFPESKSDLKEVVLFANKRNQPIVISGGRTGLCGGATAANKELIVSLEKMNKIVWAAEKNQVVCQAGAITDVVKDFVDSHDRLLPISLASSSSSSIGGNVATNAAGSKFIRYGSTKDHVAKLKVMLANGEVLTLQKEIQKDATGPNLMEIFFGSEGALGIIFEIVFNTCEKPQYSENILLRSDDIDVVKKHILAPEIKKCISSVEYWDENCQALLGDKPETKYFVVIELVSQSESELYGCLETLSELDLNIVLLNSKQAKEIWDKREDLPVILADKGAYKMDISIPIPQLKNFLNRISKLEKNEIFSFGHLGDGNIHVNIVSESKQAELIAATYDLLKDFGGSPSAEHGIGQRKKEIWTNFIEYQDKYKLLKTLKKSMDPNNILSPKVFFD